MHRPILEAAREVIVRWVLIAEKRDSRPARTKNEACAKEIGIDEKGQPGQAVAAVVRQEKDANNSGAAALSGAGLRYNRVEQ